jgi:polysaccharide pyruvyl transferase CsaB
MRRLYRVALAGYYGFGNLGDELLAEAMIASLLRCGVPRERLILLSADPADARRRFGVESVNRWKLPQVYEALGQSETLLLGGGGLFQDATSPRSCLYYWGLARLARLRGAVPWALGQSVGPLSTRAGRFLTRNSLKLCRVLQVRDQSSLTVCNALSLSAELGHDPVFSLTLTLTLGNIFNSARTAAARETDSRFLINLRPCGGANDLPERFARAVSAAQARQDARPALRYVGVALAEEDERLMSALIERGHLPPMPIERLRSLDDAARVWSGAVGAVGMRLHFAVLSVLARVPLAAVPYDPKVESFAKAHGIPLWQEGPLPCPRPVDFPEPERGKVREELDVLCRKAVK